MENTLEINKKIAQNLAYYRKEAGLTQAELAEKINYSDKSVSKWEQGNGVPDIYILLQLAKLYKVSLNDLVGEETPQNPAKERKTAGLKLMIILLSSGIVWLVATCLFVGLRLLNPVNSWWLIFLYAVVINAVVLIVYSGIWKYRLLNFVGVSALIWTGLTCLHLTISFLPSNIGVDLGPLWCIYLIGIPLQVLEVLWVFFRSLFQKAKKKATAEAEEN